MTDRLLDAQFRSDLMRIRANARVDAERQAQAQRLIDERRAKQAARRAKLTAGLSAIAAGLFAWRRHRSHAASPSCDSGPPPPA